MEEKKVKQEKIKKVFLEELPRKIYKGREFIDWKKCIGCNVKFIYEDIQGWIKIINYIEDINDKKHPKVKIKYKNNQCIISTTSFINGSLGKILHKITNEFKIEIGQVFKDRNRDIIITNRKLIEDKKGREWKMYKYNCYKCRFDGGNHYKNGEYNEELWVEESRILNGLGCQCCCKQSKIVVEGINDIPTTAPWLIEYFQGGYNEAKLYSYGNSKNITPICPYCGRIRNKEMAILNIYQTHSIGCSCGDGKSYISKFMFNVLEQLKEQKQIVEFEIENKYDWCEFYNPYKKKNCYGIYDFIIENIKLIIETDGDFHRKDNIRNGQTKEESIWIDTIKDDLANKNGYRVIRISDEENIKQNILESELIKVFDLYNIDWLKCEKFALSNLVKVACEYKRNNPDFTVTDIGEIMNISRPTIRKYLKKGMKLGWCKYDEKEELIKNACNGAERLKDFKSRSVEIFKNGQYLGIFKSVTELTNKSEELFGIKLTINGVARVARKERPHYKGFTFNYI